MAENNGGSAFPYVEYNNNGEVCGGDMGMSLRDYFATRAMQGMLSRDAYQGGWCPNNTHENGVKKVARFAYEYADAMIEARSK